jgi:hypothetical protein
MVSVPPYLNKLADWAAEYQDETPDVTPADAAYEVAHQNESLISSQSGERGPLDVLQDLKRLGAVCADEFETYRRHVETDYPESVIEAIALRSLEEFIAIQLSDDQSLSTEADQTSHEVEYTDAEGSDTVIHIHVTAKEAVDVDNALSELFEVVDSTHPYHDHLIKFNRLWTGGIEGLDDTSIMLTVTEDVEILLAALVLYEPREADFTTRLQHAIHDAIDHPHSPIDASEIGKFRIKPFNDDGDENALYLERP